MSRPTIFIDGEHGTTGLEIRQRLDALPRYEVKSIAEAHRKDRQARRDMMAAVDLAILCLPDDAAKEAAAMADEMGTEAPKLLDASTAHRVAKGWVYGFPELTDRQAALIAGAMRVSNPGCYPTGAIALIRPLVDAGIIPADHPISINAVSGYSGGGKAMIEQYESGQGPSFDLYGLSLNHKHLPETQLYAGLITRPIFVPSVGNYRQGMLVSVPLHLDTLPGKPQVADLEAALAKRYRGSTWVKVIESPLSEARKDRIDAEPLNHTNMLELRVYGSEQYRQAVLVARLDNLGKGASGAAVQNLELMLGA
ncbi:MAG: N-acetyl-gamma-glutamyl-phosphate reductase [Alphaproteobacteria bacterium]|nr:N-acetyl-gamma-glutamyl-phosphate reductase [Alphaproteobacteria bacterium]